MMMDLGASESESMVRVDEQIAHHSVGGYPALSNPGSHEIIIGTRLFHHGKYGHCGDRKKVSDLLEHLLTKMENERKRN